MKTVSTTALLVARDDASSEFVTDVLDVIYKQGFQDSYPYLMSNDEVSTLLPSQLHPAARRYFAPFDRVAWFEGILDALVATKDLALAAVAALFLCWHRWRQLREKKTAIKLEEQKNQLDEFMKQTLDIERRVITSTDVQELQTMLDAVAKVKLRAINELTHQDLRANHEFSVLIMQCGTLISHIQLKIIVNLTAGDPI